MNEYGMNEFEMVKKADVMRIINAENAVALNNLKERSTDEVLCTIASQINSLQTTAKSGSRIAHSAEVRLIDKTAAYRALKHEAETHGLSFSAEAYDRAARIIDQMPTIEPKVRHGRWIEVAKHRDENGTILTDYECSECFAMLKDSYPEEIEGERFCYNCGADMREGGADNGCTQL